MWPRIALSDNRFELKNGGGFIYLNWAGWGIVLAALFSGKTEASVTKHQPSR